MCVCARAHAGSQPHATAGACVLRGAVTSNEEKELRRVYDYLANYAPKAALLADLKPKVGDARAARARGVRLSGA